MSTTDRWHKELVAVGICALVVGWGAFPPARSAAAGLVIAAACGIALLVATGLVLLLLFARGVAGPKSLSGTRCRRCRRRHAMEEVGRVNQGGNVKVDFQHHRVTYRCSACGQQQEQDEHVFPTPPGGSPG